MTYDIISAASGSSSTASASSVPWAAAQSSSAETVGIYITDGVGKEAVRHEKRGKEDEIKSHMKAKRTTAR